MANLPSLVPTTFGEALAFAEALAKSTMVPREYQRMPANILVAIQWGAELGLGPLQALQNIAVINGKPSVYGDAMLALVRGSPLCEDVVEHIEGEGDQRTAVCEARRRGSAPVIARFSVADAKRAGLWDKVGPWKQYPERMLKFRARGFALRDAFPDVLRGVISAEEAADAPRQMKDVTPDPAMLAAELDAFAAPDLAPDQADTDELLAAARTQALAGYAVFREWYGGLDDAQRLALRPHIRALQATARQADAATPPHPEGAPDRPREQQYPSPPAPEGVPADDGPPLPRRRRNPSGPTEEEIERSQAMLEAVLGPEEGYELGPAEIAKLDQDAIPAEFEVIKPKRKGRGWDWFQYAEEMIAAGKRVPIDQLGRWRGANSSMIDVCRRSDREQWERFDHVLADYEREGRLDAAGS